jgi:hypothetical protein
MEKISFIILSKYDNNTTKIYEWTKIYLIKGVSRYFREYERSYYLIDTGLTKFLLVKSALIEELLGKFKKKAFYLKK